MPIAGYALDGKKWDGPYIGRRKGPDLVYAGKVDHGFDAENTKERLEPLIRKSQPFSNAIAESRKIQAIEHRLAPSEQDRWQRKMHFETPPAILTSQCRGRFAQRYMMPAGKALKEQYRAEARYQWGFNKPLAGDIELSITLYFGTKRKADLDNFNKLNLDALTGIAYEDDSQIAKLTIERGYDKLKPRVVISLAEM